MNDNASVSQNQTRRRRRRIRRAVAVVGFILMTTGLAWFFESQATTTVLVTRYAERLQQGGEDPDLSPQGERRARELARVLGDVDVVAGVDAIFVTPLRRSLQTGMPLASRSGVPVYTIDEPQNVGKLVQRILRDYKGKIVLVITEPDLMQPLIAEMQGSKKLPPVEPAEHDNLYVVSIPWFGKVKTLRLRYGDRYLPPQQG